MTKQDLNIDGVKHTLKVEVGGSVSDFSAVNYT